MENTKGRKRTLAIIAVVVCLALAAVGGTIAWLTASSNVTNSFTVGEITEPTTPPGDEPTPDPGDPDNNAKLDGNIYEIFDDGSKIIPGGEIQKRPWIGIGEGSESSYVFAYIDNKMMSDSADGADWTNFMLNTGWAPLENQSDVYNWTSDHYTGGLFMWVGNGNTTNANTLVGAELNDVWTNEPVFNTVLVPESAVASDFVGEPTMNVHSFIIAATDDIDTQKAIEQAVAWANDPDNALAKISGSAATE